MARKNRAFLGVVTTPYCKEDKKLVFKPHLKLGYVPKGKAMVSWDAKSWQNIEKPKENVPKIIATSNRKIQALVPTIAEELKANVIKLGGSGHKVHL